MEMSRMSCLCIMLLTIVRASAQDRSLKNEFCPQIVGVFPAGPDASSVPLFEQARFEVRRCALGDIQILVFEKDSQKPAIFLDTHDSWPRQLVNIGNILALQTVGGSGSAVYIFRFVHRKAMKVIGLDASENMRVIINEGADSVTIDVPADSRRRVPAQHFTFPIE